MDQADRLAAFLAGDLDADERTALEAELARDEELRAQLDAIRRADAALADLEAVTPPAGFAERLDAALAAPLAEELGLAPERLRPMAPADGPEDGPEDELAARRMGRQRVPRWVPAVTGAAAVVVLVVAGIAVLGPTGGDDDMVGTMADDGPFDRPAAEQDTADDAETEDAVEEAAPDAAPEAELFETPSDDADDAAPTDLDAAATDPVGPALVIGNRELDVDRARELLAGPESDAVRRSGLAGAAGTTLGAAWEETLLAGGAVEVPLPEDDAAAQLLRVDRDRAATDVDPGQDSDPADDEAGGPGTAFAVPSVRTEDGGPVRAAELDDLASCLLDLDATVGPRVPVYAELGSANGRDAFLLVLVTPDDQERYVEVRSLLLDRDDCTELARVDEDPAP